MDREHRTRREFLAGLRDVAIVATAVELGAAVVPPARAQTQPAPAAALRAGDAAVLKAVCRRVVPLRGIDEAPYLAAVAALERAAAADPGTRERLATGCDALRRELGADWQGATDATLDAYLRKVEQSPFFRTVTAIAIPTIVNQPAVWAAVGYEGESRSHVGYLHRGFDSLDWLPEPPVETPEREP